MSLPVHAHKKFARQLKLARKKGVSLATGYSKLSMIQVLSSHNLDHERPLCVDDVDPAP